MENDGRAVVTANAAALTLVLPPADVAAILGISRNKSYEVLHSEGFPKCQIGKHYRIHRDKVLTWLDTMEGKKIA